MPHKVRYLEDLEPLREGVRNAARCTVKKLNTLNTKSTDPLDALYTLKFDKSGYHPVNQQQLDLGEQLNQTFTVLASLAAAKHLLKCRPECGLLLHLAEEAGKDIESIRDGVLHAEVFASVKRRANNDKFNKDIERLAKWGAIHRYIFFYSPLYTSGRQPELEKRARKTHDIEVEVWALDRSEIV